MVNSLGGKSVWKSALNKGNVLLHADKRRDHILLMKVEKARQES